MPFVPIAFVACIINDGLAHCLTHECCQVNKRHFVMLRCSHHQASTETFPAFCSFLRADIKSLNLYTVLGKGGSLGSRDWARKMLSLNSSLKLSLNLSKNLSLLQGPPGPGGLANCVHISLCQQCYIFHTGHPLQTVSKI